MAVCAHRPEPGSMWTGCFPCVCSREVLDQLVVEQGDGDGRAG